MTLNSYAKVNLFLKVQKLRPDNYHDILTLFERISLHDTIILKKRKDNLIKIICQDKDVPKDATNLCFCAAKLLKDAFGIKSGLDIKIDKRIPVGAGLGGGSSNAATVLLGLNKLWKLKLSIKKLAALAAKLGSDVPFFIYDTPFALGEGRGEIITPLKGLKRLKIWHILIVPRIKVSTPLIYRKWDRLASGKKNKKAGLTKPCRDVKILHSNDILFNGLEPVTIGLYPQVRHVLEALADFGLNSILMSGSGPAVFGIVASRREAESLSCKLKKKAPAWRTFAVCTL